jgi:hypothetical protein
VEVATPVVPAPVASERARQANKTRWGIVAIGFVVLGLFVGAVFFNRAVGSKTVEEKTASKTTTTTKSLLSDTELSGLLAAGAVLILVGFSISGA